MNTLDHALGQQQLVNTADPLPLARLLALAMTGFIAILTETLPAGILPQIAVGLNVSPSLAGQLVTLYVAGSVVAAIPLTVATQGWRRKRVLLFSIKGFLVFNTLTAVSSSFVLTIDPTGCLFRSVAVLTKTGQNPRNCFATHKVMSDRSGHSLYEFVPRDMEA